MSWPVPYEVVIDGSLSSLLNNASPEAAAISMIAVWCSSLLA